MVEQTFKGDKFNKVEEIVRELHVKIRAGRKEGKNLKSASYDFMGNIINISYQSHEDITKFELLEHSEKVSDKSVYQADLEKLIYKLASLK